MTKYHTLFLATILLGNWGCDAPNSQQTLVVERPASNDAASIRANETFVSTAINDGNGKTFDLSQPPQNVALDLTVRTLKVELQLRDERDPAKRDKLRKEIDKLREQRQELYQQKEKGKER